MENIKLTKQIAKIKWWHQIDLGGGLITRGVANNFKTLERLGLPEDLSGKTVLDIGAWDGFYSFEAEKRGAKRVLAVDSFCWEKKSWGSKEGFKLARQVLKSKVEDKNIEVLDLSPQKVGRFDLVLFLGVLYHMRHPLLALEKVASVTKEQLILETHTDSCFTFRPAMVFYPGSELRHDPTNWWGPNPQAVAAMLKDVGFKKIKCYSRYHPFPRSFSAATYFKIKINEPFWQTLKQDRVVFHAWK